MLFQQSNFFIGSGKEFYTNRIANNTSWMRIKSDDHRFAINQLGFLFKLRYNLAMA